MYVYTQIHAGNLSINVFTNMILFQLSGAVPMTATRGHSSQIIAYCLWTTFPITLCSIYQVSLFPAVCHKPCLFSYLYTVYLALVAVVLHCFCVGFADICFFVVLSAGAHSLLPYVSLIKSCTWIVHKLTEYSVVM